MSSSYTHSGGYKINLWLNYAENHTAVLLKDDGVESVLLYNHSQTGLFGISEQTGLKLTLRDVSMMA